ncbi:MAG: hypothetical protein JSW61_04320, partial [Candidatus Thorarchaeota archaeon]
MPADKLRLIALSLALLMIFSIFPESTTPASSLDVLRINGNSIADEVWSCDFDDGNLSGWSIYAIEGYPPYENPPGHFSVEDGSLRANSTGEEFNIATHNSSVAYGTWSFDVDVVDTYNHEIVIPFLSIEWTFENWGIQSYFIQIVTGLYENSNETRLQAGKCVADSASPRGRRLYWYENFLYDDIFGWKHFVITREDNGQFYVYMNGTLALDFLDNQHTTCNEFIFST